MAKKQSIRRPSTAKTNSDSPLTKYDGPDFETLKEEMHDWANTLKCAWYALNASAVVDGDEPAAKARNVIHSCEANLVRLLENLEIWEMKTRRSRSKQGVPHGK